jgi:hypothetical protein
MLWNVTRKKKLCFTILQKILFLSRVREIYINEIYKNYLNLNNI